MEVIASGDRGKPSVGWGSGADKESNVGRSSKKSGGRSSPGRSSKKKMADLSHRIRQGRSNVDCSFVCGRNSDQPDLLEPEELMKWGRGRQDDGTVGDREILNGCNIGKSETFFYF